MITKTTGSIVELSTLNDKHFGNKVKKGFQKDDISSSFGDALKKAIGKVNDVQVKSEDLTQKMIYAPETVDVHTVMISAQKAEIALNFTKAIRDEAIRAYRDLINLR